MKTISFKALVAMLGVFALLLTTSCNKDDDATPDKAKLLTNGSWKMSAMTVDPPIDWFGIPVTDVFAKLPTCVTDDFAVFKTNGTVIYDEGASKCEPADPQTSNGTWSLNTAQTILTLTNDGETENWTIATLTTTTFKADFKVTEEGVTYTFSVTFVKK